MNKELKGTIWTTIWVVCMCVSIWILMIVVTNKQKQFDCSQHVGCGEHEMIQPEGHGTDAI